MKTNRAMTQKRNSLVCHIIENEKKRRIEIQGGKEFSCKLKSNTINNQYENMMSRYRV